MKTRKKISAPRIRDNFRFHFKYLNLKNNIFFNTQIFNSFNFLLGIIILCLPFGFVQSVFWMVGLSLVCLMGLFYLKSYRLSHGIEILRKVPSQTRERSEIEISYVITNQTAFSIQDFSFIEKFDGVQSGHFTVKLSRPLPGHTRLHLKKKVRLDSGMGIKRFEPIVINLTDDFGLFPFEVEFDNKAKIEVYPLLEETPVLKTNISTDAIDFGLYEIAKRGDSNLFIGTRDYRMGDPVKSINWKLSLKSQKLVVNEFEKNTNSYVSLVLELGLENQMGGGELSTWEHTKDLALSIAHNEIGKNNLIQVLSQNIHIPFSSGRGQMGLIEKYFTHHALKKNEGTNDLNALHHLPAGSQVYYIFPLITTNSVEESLQFIQKLKLFGHAVTLIILDPYLSLQQTIRGEMKAGIFEMNRFAQEEFKQKEIELRKMGIEIIKIQIQKNVKYRDQIIRSAPQVIEEK